MESGGECRFAQKNRDTLSSRREPDFFAAEAILLLSSRASKRQESFLTVLRGFLPTENKEVKMRILIAGCGRIGTRHLRVSKKIKGVEVIPCDPRKEVLKEIAEKL